jgi:peptide/nickel transport system permease protein
VTIWAYVVRRIALAVLVLFGVATITFLMVRIVPSDPAAVYVGSNARPEQIAQARRDLGLDKPLYVQYGIYMKNLVKGDWGDSLRTKRPVLNDIMHFLPTSLELIITALVVATIVGVIFGVTTAHRKGTWIDLVMRVFSTGGVSIPAFWLALMLQIAFFRVLHLLPVAGQSDIFVAQAHPITAITGMPVVDALITGNWPAFTDSARHLVLPMLCLAAYPMGVIMRMTRSSMLEAMGNDYIRMARALGVPPRTLLYKDALKNAFGPVLTVIGLTFAYSLTGTFFVELIFAWPGLGYYATTSILSMDYPAIMGVTIMVAAAYVLVNLAVDLAQAFLDPRIALS